MTIGLSVSLTLGAGLHAASGPVVLRRGFAAAWGTTEVNACHATTWDLARSRAWRYEIGWTLHFVGTLRTPYGLRLEGNRLIPYGDLRLHRRNLALAYGDARLHRQRLALPYGEARRHRGRVAWPYGEVAVLRGRFEFPSGDVAVLRKRHRVPYADLGACRQTLRLAWWLTETLTGRHALGYGVTDVNPVVRRHTASWSLLADQHLQAVVNTPELLWQGRTIRILQATLSCDEDSPVWIASVELAALADFAAIAIGDAITLVLGQETFHLVVDGKTLSRESQTSQRCVLTAISPLALLDAPFAGTIRFYRPEALSAHEAVESLIGPVDWQLPDWLIPAGRLLLEGVTPLAAVRSLVAAIGGIVESAPDGSVICRRRHPVSIPGYGQAAVAHPLFDADVLASRARIAPARGYNRITLANEEGAAGSAGDRIEYVVDPEDDNRGTLRVYLANQLASGHPVLLTHTGHPATVIAALGEVVRPEREVVEFIEGRASTRYPVLGLVGHSWRHADLGAVTAEGQSLAATVPGYSLLDLTYTTRTLDWRVALAADEEVQFVLVDA